MMFEKIHVYQNLWYQDYGIKRSTFYHYNNMFKNGDLKVVNGNSGLQKYRPNIIGIVLNINNIMEKNKIRLHI